MIRLGIVMIALAPTLMLVTAQAQEAHSLSFSKWERRPPHHTYEINVDAISRNNHPIWLATRVDKMNGAPDQTTWADSETCPAITVAFAKLQRVEPFRIVPPGVHEGPNQIVLDGDSYEVKARGYWVRADRDGEIVLSGNSGTPVAGWVEDTMNTLASCWAK